MKHFSGQEVRTLAHLRTTMRTKYSLDLHMLMTEFRLRHPVQDWEHAGSGDSQQVYYQLDKRPHGS